MKGLGKNKVLATLLLSASTIGIENVESGAFSSNFVLDGSLTVRQLNEIENIEGNSIAFKKYVKISKNTGKQYKQVVSLTLAGIRKENNDKWKTILRALKRTKKTLIIRFSNDFENANQSAYSTTNKYGHPVIVLNKEYFDSTNIGNLQGTLCHEIGHVYMDSILINSRKQKSWTFDDRYIEDFIDPSEQTDELLKFSEEYRLHKKRVENGQLNKYGETIYTKSEQPLTRYGLRSRDDTEMIADTIRDYFMTNSKEPIILKHLRIKCAASLASHAIKQESKLNNAK